MFRPIWVEVQPERLYLLRKVYLSPNLSVTTDGLNNLSKASRMAESNVPLLAIKSSKDYFMGTTHKANKRFQENFADDLLKARYGELKSQNMITLETGHVGFFVEHEEGVR